MEKVWRNLTTDPLPGKKDEYYTDLLQSCKKVMMTSSLLSYCCWCTALWHLSIISVHCTAVMVLVSGSNAPSIRSPVVDEKTMRPGHWLWSVIVFS